MDEMWFNGNMEKLLLADCYGVRCYDEVTFDNFERFKDALDSNDKSRPSLSIITVDDIIHSKILKMLFRHQFDEALLYVKQYVYEVIFSGNLSEENWKMIPDRKLDKE